MPHVRVAHRAGPAVPIRPVLPSHRTVARPPVKQRTPIAPRFLPVLQPPKFPNQSDFIYEGEDEEEEQQDVKQNHPATPDNEHNRKIPQQLLVRVPTFVPQQNYPKQPLPRLTTHTIRHAEPKYSTHLYFNR
jgi:hypothetical protein